MTKKEICILSTLVVLIVAAVIAVVAVRNARAPEPVVGEFIPPSFAENALDGAPEPAQLDGLPYGTLTLSEEISVSMVSNLTVEENGNVEIWFTAPAANKGWVALRLMDEKGNVLGESGLLKPGQYIKTMQLDQVPKKGGIVLAKILTYEPDTYYSMGSASAQVMLRLNGK